MCFHSRELLLFSFLSFNSLNFIRLLRVVFSRLKFRLGMTYIRRPNHTIKYIAARILISIFYWFLYFVTLLPWYTQPGGSLVITTINQTALSYAAAIVGAEYILRLVTPGTHDWNKFVTVEELIDLISLCKLPRTWYTLWQCSLKLRILWLFNVIINYS